MKTRATVHGKPAQEQGFSLICTVLLLVLLALVGLGLLSLSTISLRGSQTAQAHQEAQANARLAMMIAIGELQKYGGPDQRVTARADIQEQPGNSGSLKQPWLTGVWRTEDNPRSTALGRDLRLKRLQKLPAYLISGNERYNLLAPDPASGSYPAGYVTPEQPLPAGSGNRPGDVEVGCCSWAGKEQAVRAPLMALPGAKGTQGGYAYWVEDEGVKARLNLSNPFDKPADKVETHAAGALGHRNRVDWITKGGASGQPGDTLASLPKAGDDPLFPKLITMDTVAFSGTNPKASRDDLKRLSSDLTTSSRSLLVDMQRGGFRRDLTAAFRNSSLSSLVGQGKTFDTELIFPQQGTPNDGETGANLYYRPGGAPWSVLKDYANYATRVTSKSQVLDVRDWLGNVPVQGAAAPTYNGRDLNAVSQLYPVLNRAQMLFDVSYEDVGGGNHDVMFHLFPSIVLWNPYDQPLRVPKFRVDFAANISWNAGPTAVVQPLGFEYRLEAGTYTYVGTPPVGNPKVVFDLRFYSGKDVVIPAGKSIVLTTPARHIQYNAGSVAGQELVPVWQDGFGLFIRGARVKFNNPAAPSRISVAQADADNNLSSRNDFGGETRMLSQELGLQLSRINWNIDGNPPSASQPSASSFINFVPKVRTPAQPLTSASPKWGGVLSRKFIESQLQPMATDPTTPNGYPAKSVAAYNLRAHHGTWTGNALMSPLQFITGNVVPDPLGNLDPYVKPQIANASTSGGPHYAYVGGSDVQGTDQCSMFHVPRDQEPVLSLAQFSHANLGRPVDIDVHRHSSIGEELDPTYPIGNSVRPPHHPADQLKAYTTGQWDWSVAYRGQQPNVGHLYRADTSFLYNNALWDTYYLSGYEPGKEKFLNARLNWGGGDATAKAAMDDPMRALSKVYLDGGFNVNSTSKAAWKALLASTVGIRDTKDGGAADKPGYNRIPQSETAFASLDSSMTASSADPYFNDARMLDEKSLDMLAEQIVQQVKLRGPFPTLASFVNRSVDPASHARSGLTQEQVCNQGALQAALDGTDANRDVNQGVSRSDWVKASQLNSSWQPYKSSVIGHVYPDAAEGARGFGAPLYLMPSDILAKIGPFLTARSDTFKIQAYGESRDASGNLRASVRCEAIIQRVPQWTGDRLSATDLPVAGSPEARYGRKLQIVSFRWLNNEELSNS